MYGEDFSKVDKYYLLISFFLVIVILFSTFYYLINVDLNAAYINDDFLDGTWYENLEFREKYNKLFGLNKEYKLRYEINDKYFSYLLIVTNNNINVLNSGNIESIVENKINLFLDKNIVIYGNSEIKGERLLKNVHKSYYIIFDGYDKSVKPYENVKIIAETWNCGIKDKSIFCLGVSQITDKSNNDLDINTINWEKIVGDINGTFGNEGYKIDDGLIFNINCH